MSELSKNGKNLILENTIVSYSPKDDTIHITSADPDLNGEPFHISLNQSSQTENTLRQLLVDKGIIKEEIIGSNLPESLTIPESFNDNPNIFDLGVSRHGIFSWNPAKDSHIGVFGHTGSGKTVIANSILFQALSNQEIWDIYCFDPEKVEYSHVKEKINNPKNYTTNLNDLFEIVKKIFDELNRRFEIMSASSKYKSSSKGVILFIDSIFSVLEEEYNDSVEVINIKHQLFFMISQILRKGRAAGVHVVFTSQSPQFVKPEIFENIPSTVFMGRTNEFKSKIVLGSNIAVRTPNIRGRGYFKLWNDEPTQFQAYWTPVAKFDELPDKR